MSSHTYPSLQRWYQDHLETVILPFWLQRGIDTEYGGFFTCFDNAGAHLVSHNKYTWSQGRFIWLLARLARLSQQGLVHQDADALLAHAHQGVAFVTQHAFLQDGSCAYLLDRFGAPRESIPGQGFDTSFFADCFVILGFAEYAQVAHDPAVLERALALCDWTQRRVLQGTIRSEPYPVPPRHSAHSVPMIMLNVTQEMATALEAFGHPRANEMRQTSWTYLHTIMDHFAHNGLIAEMIPEPGVPDETVLARHITPGHMLESMWFVMTEAHRAGQPALISQAADIIANAMTYGWDPDEGGLFRYADRAGGAPTGALIGDPYEQLVLDTWDTKLWWPHAEGLYSTLLAYSLTGDEKFRTAYERLHTYVFSTFPNPDRTIGEWIQIRDRHGHPLEKVVALPVKDPYHIVRDILLILQLTADMSARAASQAASQTADRLDIPDTPR